MYYPYGNPIEKSSYDSTVLTYDSVVLTKDTGVIRVRPIDCDQWKAEKN